MTDKKMPQHVVDQRAAANHKPLRRAGIASEPYDVFRRINMHDGNRDVCWEWTGAHGLGTRGEYRPRVVIGMKDLYVYRVVYELYTGYKLQAKDVVRHQCDNSWCCNPFHMIIGSQADNVQDMLKRERVGMKHFHIKRIMQMLEIGATADYIVNAMKQGYAMTIDASMIRKIKMRRIYKHIEWQWGDDWAKQRRARLNAIKQQRLAGDPSSGIMDSQQHNGEGNDEETNS